jgi:hypothetical protein
MAHKAAVGSGDGLAAEGGAAFFQISPVRELTLHRFESARDGIDVENSAGAGDVVAASIVARVFYREGARMREHGVNSRRPSAVVDRHGMLQFFTVIVRAGVSTGVAHSMGGCVDDGLHAFCGPTKQLSLFATLDGEGRGGMIVNLHLAHDWRGLVTRHIRTLVLDRVLPESSSRDGSVGRYYDDRVSISVVDLEHAVTGERVVHVHADGTRVSVSGTALMFVVLATLTGVTSTRAIHKGTAECIGLHQTARVVRV